MPNSQTKFHVSLQVKDLAQSVEFYGRLLGKAPAKYFTDYAKFECDDPGLVLSLEKKKQDNTQPLSHMGIRLSSRNDLVAWSSQVAERGIDYQHLDNVACCYADQSKIYMNDPDGILFEIYHVNRDLEPSTSNAQPQTVESQKNIGDGKSYDHILPTAFPEKLPFADGTLEKISLRGTLNAAINDQTYFEILRECQRALKPGGELVLHMLVSDVEPKEEIPTLPEPAAYVRRVPQEMLIWDLVREAGFVGLHAKRFSAHHVFEFKGSHCRELLLEACKRKDVGEKRHTCTYVGPFPKIETENGECFERGKRQSINAATYALISSSAYKAAFVFLNDEGNACGS